MLMVILDMLYFPWKKGIVSVWKSEELYMVFMKITIELRVLNLLWCALLENCVPSSGWISDITSDRWTPIPMEPPGLRHNYICLFCYSS